MKHPITHICILSLLITVTGCGDDHSHGHDHGHGDQSASQVAEACKHFEDEMPVPLSADGNLTTHARYKAALASVEDKETFEAQINYTYAGDTKTHYLLLSAEASVELEGPDGVIKHSERMESPMDCTAAKVVFVFDDLKPAEYKLSFEAEEESELEMSIHVTGDSHDHDH